MSAAGVQPRHPRRHHERGLTEAWRSRRPQPRRRATADAVGRHPHLAAPVPAGWVRVDLHSHTMWSRRLDDDARRARAGGRRLRASTCCASPTTTRSRAPASWPARCRAGWSSARSCAPTPARSSGCSSPSACPFGVPPGEAARRIRAQGGAGLRAPPVRPDAPQPGRAGAASSSSTPAWSTPSRCFNAKTSLRHLNDRAAAFAAEHDLAAGAGSDAHVPDALGAAYVEMPDFDGPADFLAKLREPIVGHHAIPTVRGGLASCRARRPKSGRRPATPWCRAART